MRIWETAERRKKLFLILGIVLAMLPLTVLVMLPCLGKSQDAVGICGSIVSVVECAVLLLSVIPTERALKRLF